jgi:acid phosphatase family membrane protein YuiD
MHGNLFISPVLIAGLVSWWIGQTIKVPIEYLRTHSWNWALLFSAGGMPSTHSALMSSITLSIGLFDGFNTPLFALAFAVSMVVMYDATGIRRQAGMHAQKINVLINELFSGQSISDEQLKEVLGHSPFQVLMGIILGTTISLVNWLIFRP